MKKQVLLFFVIFTAIFTLAQVLITDHGISWQLLLQSGLAGVLSTFLFWLIIKEKKGKG